MSAIREIRRHSLAAVVPVICFAAIGYFAYHAMEGEHGINAYTRLTLQIQDTKAALGEVTAERKTMERRVGLLRASGLDADMLEEQGKKVLGLIKPGERVILGR
ncbi:septum formation initiator family protein [Ferrovibrio terrae]|uniref:Septum formation initiator family protein n=1 Tax=Ferrovibrio terrae TaxID=2594003 RepID=A0A516H3Z3_9PROT|nr:septum formation initiator family protein [Ferrovibrio terrae]QDO98494.1 septum formation initiator family protein [Ferrovibrio terrae]